VNGAVLEVLEACSRRHHVFDLVNYAWLATLCRFLKVVLLVAYVRQVLHVWLKLLEKDKTEGDQCLWIDVI